MTTPPPDQDAELYLAIDELAAEMAWCNETRERIVGYRNQGHEYLKLANEQQTKLAEHRGDLQRKLKHLTDVLTATPALPPVAPPPTTPPAR